VAFVALAVALASSGRARADTPSEALTPERRAELEKEYRQLKAEVLKHYRAGAYREALPLQERALAVCRELYPEKAFPDGHPDLAESLNDLGFLLQALGERRRALRYYERALAMSERLYPKRDHPDLARSHNNLGLLLQDMGEPRRALEHLERALGMCQRLYPERDHPHLAHTLNNLGVLLQRMGKPRQALRYLQDALDMRERLYPKQDHPAVASSLTNLGNLLGRLGERRRALEHLERALDMYERLYPKQDHPVLALTLNNVGELLAQMGEMRRALRLWKRTLAMCERLYPRQDHPHLATSLTNLGLLLQAQGEPRQGLAYLARALAVNRRVLDDVAFSAPEAEALAFAASLPRAGGAYLSFARAVPDSDAAAYDHAWASKAAVTRVLRRRHLAARAATGKARDAWDDLLDTRRRLARLFHSPAPDPAARDREARRLTDRKEQRERELAALLPELPRQQELDRLGPDGLAARLPEGTAFVDFLRFNAFALDKARWTRTPSYAAFVLVRGRPVRRVELGPARPLDDAVTAWRQAVEAWKPTLAPAARRDLRAQADRLAADLRRLVWDKVARHLPPGTRTVYLSPDGDLARLPWAALPDPKTGRVLLEDYALAVVPHGPFLLERLAAPPAKGEGPGRLLAVGGVTYDPPGGPPRGGPYRFLPGSADEAGQVLALAGGRPRRSLRGAEATPAALLEELPKARYAHLASHGFFAADRLAEERRRLDDQLKGWEFAAGRTTERVGLGLRSPLVYTGVALAGANRPEKAGPDGGILTGEALVELPLEGLRLCVLSACETGLGAYTQGEGVTGLVRAFHLAGCPDVVASLWHVHDRATAALMAKFYHELWVKQRPPLEALREAQLLVYRRPDLLGELAGERGPVRQKEAVRVSPSAPPAAEGKGPRADRSPPKLWAGFVLSGTGR
jgi:CHAT domain-containing protein/tetratricopeptide (TPR) repeat protein